MPADGIGKEELITMLKAENERLRNALEQIAGHFLPGNRTYAGVHTTLDMIREEAREALNHKAPPLNMESPHERN